jgi:hypothetical protein
METAKARPSRVFDKFAGVKVILRVYGRMITMRLGF